MGERFEPEISRRARARPLCANSCREHVPPMPMPHRSVGFGVTGVSLLGADSDEKVTRRVITIWSYELLERLLNLNPHLLLLDRG